MGDQNSQEEFVRTLEFGEDEGWADQFSSAPEDLGCRTVRFGGVYVFIMPQYDNRVFNKVIGLGLTESVTEKIVDEIITIYQDAGIQNYAFQICPAAQSTTLVGWMDERGIRPISNWVKMYRPLGQAKTMNTDLRIERIGTEYAKDYSRVGCEGFGHPDHLRPYHEASIGNDHWHHYLAFDGDVPVAVAALFIKGKVASFLGAATLESHRRMGAQSALLARRIEDADDAGCEWMVSETWEEQPEFHNSSYHNMLRAGFKLAYPRPNFMKSD